MLAVLSELGYGALGAGTPFVFRDPLGKAREVKVALSGLFGRFVARAAPTRLSAYLRREPRSLLR